MYTTTKPIEGSVVSRSIDVPNAESTAIRKFVTDIVNNKAQGGAKTQVLYHDAFDSANPYKTTVIDPAKPFEIIKGVPETTVRILSNPCL